jgi:hypothetical protein
VSAVQTETQPWISDREADFLIPAPFSQRYTFRVECPHFGLLNTASCGASKVILNLNSLNIILLFPISLPLIRIIRLFIISVT